MVRLVSVTVPGGGERAGEVLAILRDRCSHVHGVTHLAGPVDSVIQFKAVEKHISATMLQLERIGVGIDFGSIDILALQSTKPLISTLSSQAGKKKRKYKLSDRMTVEEIFENVDSQSHLTFDYLMMVVVAAIIAGVGLISDSSVTVVASMLVSPLMGPILCITFGTAIRQRKMVWRGLRNEIWGIVLCIVVGLMVGAATAPFFGPCGVQTSWSRSELRSDEIESRGTLAGLVSGFFVAAPSGVGVALAITGGGINALVGVAISAALLPPIVNSGLCLAFSAWYWSCTLSLESKNEHWVDGNPANGTTATYNVAQHETKHFGTVAYMSFVLFLMNWFLIFTMALIIFKVKKIKAWKKLGEFAQEHMAEVSLTRVQMDARRRTVGGEGDMEREEYIRRKNPLEGRRSLGTALAARKRKGGAEAQTTPQRGNNHAHAQRQVGHTRGRSASMEHSSRLLAVGSVDTSASDMSLASTPTTGAGAGTRL